MGRLSQTIEGYHYFTSLRLLSVDPDDRAESVRCYLTEFHRMPFYFWIVVSIALWITYFTIWVFSSEFLAETLPLLRLYLPPKPAIANNENSSKTFGLMILWVIVIQPLSLIFFVLFWHALISRLTYSRRCGHEKRRKGFFWRILQHFYTTVLCVTFLAYCTYAFVTFPIYVGYATGGFILLWLLLSVIYAFRSSGMIDKYASSCKNGYRPLDTPLSDIESAKTALQQYEQTGQLPRDYFSSETLEQLAKNILLQPPTCSQPDQIDLETPSLVTQNSLPAPALFGVKNNFATWPRSHNRVLSEERPLVTTIRKIPSLGDNLFTATKNSSTSSLHEYEEQEIVIPSSSALFSLPLPRPACASFEELEKTKVTRKKHVYWKGFPK